MSDLGVQLRLSQIFDRRRRILDWHKPVHLISGAGIGKTSLVHQIGEAENMPVIVTNLAQATPVDIPGYAIPDKDEQGRMYSNNALPFWSLLQEGTNLTTAFDLPRGILFLDEYGQADVDTKKASAPLIHERRAGRFHLPDGWVVWLASNRMSDRSGVTRSLDFIINRTCEIHVAPHKDDLINWLVDQGYPPLLRAYVSQRPGNVFQDAPKEQSPWMTPRSTVAAFDYLMLCTSDGGQSFQTDSVDKAFLAGTVGLQNAGDLMTFLELYEELPTKEDILADPMKAKMPTKLDAQMVVVQMLAYDVTEDTADAVITYVRRKEFSQDMAVTFAKTAAMRNTKLLMTKAFTKWTAENHTLLAAVAALSKM